MYDIKDTIQYHTMAKFHYSTPKSVRDILKINEICQFSHIWTDPVTLTFGQGQWNRYGIKANTKFYIMAKFHYSTPKSVRDILNINEICQFSHFWTNAVTLTFDQGQQNWYGIKGTMEDYSLAKFHYFTLNSVWDILNTNEICQFSHFWTNPVTLTVGQGQ